MNVLVGERVTTSVALVSKKENRRRASLVWLKEGLRCSVSHKRVKSLQA